MKPVQPGDLRIVSRNACLRTAVLAFWLGGLVIALVYENLPRPAAAEPPRQVPAMLMKIGQSLCDNWSGLANIARVSDKAYTFTCNRHAVFAGVSVHLSPRHE